MTREICGGRKNTKVRVTIIEETVTEISGTVRLIGWDSVSQRCDCGGQREGNDTQRWGSKSQPRDRNSQEVGIDNKTATLTA